MKSEVIAVFQPDPFSLPRITVWPRFLWISFIFGAKIQIFQSDILAIITNGTTPTLQLKIQQLVLQTRANPVRIF